MQDELLQLMINFKLCFKIPGSKDKYIAPQLLTENQPAYVWNETNNLILRYTYDFMPKGIITQLIVAMNEWIADQECVWKSGVILEKDDTKAEVVEYYGKREIKIRISGKHKRDFMTIVMHEIDKIHDSYKRLKYNKLIPCNCVTCKNSQEPHFYKFETLREFIANRKNKIQCLKTPPYEMVNVLGLIDDVIDFRKTEKNDMDYLKDDLMKTIRESGIHIDARSVQTVNQTQTVSQQQTTEVTIEVNHHINMMDSTFRNMKEDMLDEVKDDKEKEKLGRELQKVEKAIGEVKQIKNVEEAKSSPALDRVKRFIDKLNDTTTMAGKAIKAVEDGIGYTQDLAKNYNKIAQWCSLPVVPDLFLKQEFKG